jgi:hypothetical protein
MPWRQILIAPALASVASCATIEASTATMARAGPGCETQARSLASAPGEAWLREQGWRFGSMQSASSAYSRLVQEASPWPDWIKPQPAILPAGTRFQMAIGGAQTPHSPGSFGTFDNVDEVEDVRSRLAVKKEWKAQVDRVVTYEVTRPLPVKVGPVGPQVDGRSCRLLIGRWSQLQMTVPADARMSYLKVVRVRPIR